MLKHRQLLGIFYVIADMMGVPMNRQEGLESKTLGVTPLSRRRSQAVRTAQPPLVV